MATKERLKKMEKRAASHTEEEELNQRRRLLNSAKKGDERAINKLFELYQVRVYSGELLSKPSRIPAWPTAHPKHAKTHAAASRPDRKKTASARRTTQRAASRKTKNARSQSRHR